MEELKLIHKPDLFASHSEVLYALNLTYQRAYGKKETDALALMGMETGAYVIEHKHEVGIEGQTADDYRLFLEEMGLVLTNRRGIMDIYKEIRKHTRITVQKGDEP